MHGDDEDYDAVYDAPDERLRRLWRCVLSQAAIDAQSQINNKKLQHEGRHARAWLTHPSKDLAFVCHLAGYEHHYALEHFQRYFNQPKEKDLNMEYQHNLPDIIPENQLVPLDEGIVDAEFEECEPRGNHTGERKLSDAERLLKTYVDRIMNLEEQKQGIADDIKAIFAEAKATGFDTKALKAAIDCMKNLAEAQEHYEMLNLYLDRLGLPVLCYQTDMFRHDVKRNYK